jgi:hypothetical protein
MLLQVVFAAQHKGHRFDLEAVEMATRASLHRAGAAALSALLGDWIHPAAPRAFTTRVPGSCSQCWVGCGSSAAITSARTVIGATAHATGSWISKTRSIPPACVA